MAKIESISKAFALGLPAVAAAGLAGVLLAAEAHAQATVQGINAPNGAGVSVNNPSSFNVPKAGVVLNNSNDTNCAHGTSCTSALGATVSSAFGTGATASLILEQVTGGSNSSLQGTLEIYGGKADFVLANPAGVTCDGCGFINTPRVTLTTGTANFDSSGAVNGFSITGGSVTIGAGGANVNGLTFFDVIAAATLIQGKIGTPGATQPGEIGVFAGSNFNYNTRTVSGSTANAPAIAIDSSALGGAYAGKIQLISTQSGAGVNTPALQAGAGGINLSADGKIVFGNTQAQGDIKAITTSSGNIELANAVSANTLTLTAAGAVTVDAGVKASSTNGSTVIAGTNFTNNGTLSSQSAISITTQTGDLTNAGLIQGQTLTLAAARTLSNTVNSQLTSNTAITLSANAGNSGDGISNDGSITAGTTVGITQAAFLTNTGQITAQGALTASQIGDLTNSGAISGQSLSVAATGTLANQPGGQLTSTTGGMTLSANTITNANIIASGTTLNVNNTADLINMGQITANGALTASLSGDLTNTASISGLSITAQAAGTINNMAGASFASGTGGTSLTGGTLTNRGSISSAGTTMIGTTSGDLTNGGSISGQLLNVNAAGTLANQAGGTLTSTANTALSAKTLINAGSVSAGTTLGVTASGDLTNTGNITAQQDATLNAGGTLTNGIAPTTPSNATILAGGTLNISAGTLKNFGDADLFKARAEISGQFLNIVTSGDVQNTANLFATQDLTIRSSGNVTNGFGFIRAGNRVSITAAGSLNNIVGLIQGSSSNFSAASMQNAVLVRPDDDLLLPKKLPNIIRPITTQDIAQAVTGWDKAVLARFGTTDNKVLDKLRLQLGDPFLMQQEQQKKLEQQKKQEQEKQGKGASNLPQPGRGAATRHADAVAHPAAF